MSFWAGTEASKLAAALAGFAGVGAFVFPFAAPWFLALVALAGAAGFLALPSASLRLGWAVVAMAITVGVLGGVLAPSLAPVVLATAALAMLGRAHAALILVIVALHLSSTTSAEALLADALAPLGMEPAAPAVVAAAALLLVRPRSAAVGSIATCLSLALAWGGAESVQDPALVQFVVGIPVAALAGGLAHAAQHQATSQRLVPVCAAFALAMGTWPGSMPRAADEIFVLVPNAPDAYEAQFFENYAQAARFANLHVQPVAGIDALPPGAFLLLPWLTNALPVPDESIGEAARAGGWTVILGGEHTNVGDVASRVARIAGRGLLRDDLSVPPGNSDRSGFLRAPSVRAWPADAVLNRGATARPTGLGDRVLLSGDGWWAEPDRHEWLWVGDYAWEKGDRRGRLPLMVAAEAGDARFVVVGDNSAIINRQIIADPRPFLRLIELASLWPALTWDLMLCLLAFAATAIVHRKTWAPLAAAIPAVALAPLGAVVAVSGHPGELWRAVYLGESGFNERNFNKALAEEPRLWTSGWRLRRTAAPLSGDVEGSPGDEVLFTLVDGEARFGSVRLGTCRRIGALATESGPTLMDAQACAVHGSATPLLGTKTAAAAVLIEDKNVRRILVLDLAFLSQAAPRANRAWLLARFAEYRR